MASCHVVGIRQGKGVEEGDILSVACSEKGEEEGEILSCSGNTTVKRG